MEHDMLAVDFAIYLKLIGVNISFRDPGYVYKKMNFGTSPLLNSNPVNRKTVFGNGWQGFFSNGEIGPPISQAYFFEVTPGFVLA